MIVALFSSVIELKPMATDNKQSSHRKCVTPSNFIFLVLMLLVEFLSSFFVSEKLFAFIFPMNAHKSFRKMFEDQIWIHLFHFYSQGFSSWWRRWYWIFFLQIFFVIIFTLIQNKEKWKFVVTGNKEGKKIWLRLWI